MSISTAARSILARNAGQYVVLLVLLCCAILISACSTPAQGGHSNSKRIICRTGSNQVWIDDFTTEEIDSFYTTFTYISSTTGTKIDVRASDCAIIDGTKPAGWKAIIPGS